MPPELSAREITNPHISNHTLIVARWLAIIGQSAAAVIAHFVFGIHLLLPAFATYIFLSISVNIFAIKYHGRVALTTRQAFFYILHDTIQLAALLYLSGGLDNPFAIMLVAPLLIAASLLPLRHIIVLVTLNVFLLLFLQRWHIPLAWPVDHFEMHHIKEIAFFCALFISSMFMSFYIWRSTQDSREMAAALHITKMALARQQKLGALGAQATAAVHELGSPLATIAVIAGDMRKEKGFKKSVQEDIALLNSQIARCQDILYEMSHSQDERINDKTMVPIPPKALIDVIIAPHRENHPNTKIYIRERGEQNIPPPLLYKTPELSYGLGNLLQNALQFARHYIEIDLFWDENDFSILIHDDGNGFPSGILSKIGEPYISTRSNDRSHMGLGIFIAKSFLESSGARLSFKNASYGGAEVKIRWPRKTIEASQRTL